MNSSPQRGSFQRENIIKRVESGETTAEKAEELFEVYKSVEQQRRELEKTDEWKEYNMEYDLRSTKWICDKAKSSDKYAQNLYAAMCNNEFVKNDVWPLLTDKRWSCSWRSAGGIIANMVEYGDYIEWYCSGIRDVDSPDVGYVSESNVTDEIREDLLKLGWIVINE